MNEIEPELRDDQPPRRKRKVSWFVVPFALALIVPSFVVYGPSLIRFKLIREPLFAMLNAKLPGSISVSSMKVSLARGVVECENLQMLTKSGNSVISVEYFLVQIVPKELFDDTIHVTKLIIKKPKIQIGSDSTGMFNIVSIFADSLAPADPNKPKTPFAFKISVDSVEIDSLSGTYFMEKPKLSAEIGSLSITGNCSMFPFEGKFNITGSEISYHDRNRNIITNKLELYAVGSDSSADSVNLRVQTPNETLQIRGHAGGWLRDSIEVHANVDGDFSLAMIKEISGANIGDGKFLAHCRVDGGIGNPTITGYLGYRGNSLAGTGINLIDLPVKLRDRIVSTPNGKVTRNDGTIVQNVALTVGLQGYFPHGFTKKMGGLNTLWYRGKADGFALKIPATNLPLKTNYLDLSIDGHGIFPDSLDFRTTFEYRTIGIQNGQSVPLKLTGSVAMKRQIVGVSGVKLEVDHKSFISTDGSVNIKAGTMNLAVNLERTDVAKIKPFIKGGFPVEGVLGGTINLNGKYATPEIEFDLAGSNMVATKYPLGEISAKGTVSPKQGELKAVGSVQGSTGNLNFDFAGNLFKSGSFSLKKVPFAKVTGTADSLNLSILSNQVVDGLARGTLEYSGSVGSGSGRVSFEVDSIRNKQFMIPKIIVESAVNDSVVTVENCMVSLYDSIKVNTRGIYKLDGNYDFSIDSDTIEPRRFVPALPADPKILLVAHGSATGSVKNPSADVTFTIPNLFWNDISIGTQAVRAVLGDSRVIISGNGIADLEGQYDLKSTEYKLNASVGQFLLDPYFSAFGQKTFVGSLDGDLFVQGNSKGLDTAILKLPVLTIKQDSFDLIEGKTVVLSVNKNGLTLDSLSLNVMNSGTADISGTVSPNQVMNLAINADLPLGIIERFTTAVDRVNGKVHLQGTIKGTPKVPLVEASAKLDSVSMVVASSQQKIHDLSGGIRYEGSLFKVEKLKGQLDDGSFSANGTVNLHKNRPFSGDFRARLYNLPLSIPETADLRLGGNLRFTADSLKQGLSGTLDLIECYYYQRINPIPSLDPISKKNDATIQKQDSPLDHTDLSIRIVPRKNIFVDNNLAVFDIHPELKIGGTVSNPLIEGRMDIRSGDLSYLNRKFSVTRGTIEYINPEKNEPEVNIFAETTIDQWKISLQVQGIVGKDLKYSSTSVPPLQDNELTALLITGKPTFLEGVDFNSTEYLMKQFFSAAKERLGVDMEVDFKNNSVKIGEDVTRRVKTDYQILQEQKGMKQVASVLIKLFDQLNVSGFANTEGRAGGEIQVHAKIR